MNKPNVPVLNMRLDPSFGDPIVHFVIRDWVEKALVNAGGKIVGKGMGCGQCDLDLVVGDEKYNVSIVKR